VREEDDYGRLLAGAHPKRRGYMAAASPPPKSKFKKGKFVDVTRLNVLRDLPSSQNNLLKSAKNGILEILKMKLTL
jgi:hypothetical protein